MTKDASLSELEKLREEVAELKATKQAVEQSLVQDAPIADEAEPPVQAMAQDAVESPTEEHKVTDDSEKAEQQVTSDQAQLEELKALLAKEIKDLPTVTTLAVFSLGILMGRYLR
ncbi:hypothetical protein LP316_07795 [Thalassotalea sp. LPB0316]|uniref:hypothetical protein n=1 Tax=Thalassotalea sp. LPB0316 TaxID=2769490 RepID=UPI0018685B62|nr:hypothetical protein [Thalassotalea sp. LPB0316]QOL27177.1 hypothetical protein LP316_07795 [Thalassotalea sp. LPB0316]